MQQFADIFADLLALIGAAHNHAHAKPVDSAKYNSSGLRGMDRTVKLAARLTFGDMVRQLGLERRSAFAQARCEFRIAHRFTDDIAHQRRPAAIENFADKHFCAKHQALYQVFTIAHVVEQGVAALAVGADDGGDDFSLGRKIAVDCAGGELRLRADFMHRRLMKAAAAKTCQGRVHDLTPAPLTQVRIRNARHSPQCSCRARLVDASAQPHYKANVRSLNVNGFRVNVPPMTPSPLRQALLIAVSASALAGCSLLPKERPTPPPLPSAFPTAGTSAVAAAADVPLTDWWKGFSDPTLDALIAEGLERSPTVRQAALRVRTARAQSRQTLSTYLPSVSGTGRAQYTRSIEGPGLFGSTPGGAGGGDATPEAEQAIGSYGLSASWEIPLFARLEAAVVGARANTRAANEDVRGARVTLAADIADAYVDLRTSQNRLKALREGADISLSLADILKISADAGIASPSDAADARRQAENTRAALADVEIGARQSANTLSTLRARAPGTEPAAIAVVLNEPAPVPTITLAGAPAAPADLVRLRPDIARAEANAIVAAAQVGVSRADLLPSLNLTGALTTSDNLIGSALSQITTEATATPSISIPLLDWGQRFAAIDVSKSRFKSALIDYETAVNQGVSEASLALTQLEQGQMRLDRARAAEAAAEITANGTRASFGAGIASLSDRLRSDQQFLDAQTQRIQAEASAAKAAIAVYRAFGGGPPDLSQTR